MQISKQTNNKLDNINGNSIDKLGCWIFLITESSGGKSPTWAVNIEILFANMYKYMHKHRTTLCKDY